jgi:hypothetical protein
MGNARVELGLAFRNREEAKRANGGGGRRDLGILERRPPRL